MPRGTLREAVRIVRGHSFFPAPARPLFCDRFFVALEARPRDPRSRHPSSRIEGICDLARFLRASRPDRCLDAVLWWAMAEFRWLGHNCFRIRAREATVLTDPVDRSTGFAVREADRRCRHHLPRAQGSRQPWTDQVRVPIVRGPGEYEMHDIFITGIRTYHDDEKGKLRGYNTVYIIEVEGMRICHLGDLGHALTEEQAEALSNVDVLLVPAGGGDVMSPTVAAEVVTAAGAQARHPDAVRRPRSATSRWERSKTSASTWASRCRSQKTNSRSARLN